MRFLDLYEALDRINLTATRRFVDEWHQAASQNAGLVATFEAFLEAKDQNPPLLFRGNDKRFTNGSKLEGWWHAHLVHGKIVVVYDWKGRTLRLAALVSHREYDGGNPPLAGFANTLNKTGDTYFAHLDEPAPEDEPLAGEVTAEQVRQAVEHAFYDLASNPDDRATLEDVARDRLEGLAEHAPYLDFDMRNAVRVYGHDGLIKLAKAVLSRTK